MSVSNSDVDPFYADRMFLIEQRAIEREQKMAVEAEKMAKDLDFDGIT